MFRCVEAERFQRECVPQLDSKQVNAIHSQPLRRVSARAIGRKGTSGPPHALAKHQKRKTSTSSGALCSWQHSHVEDRSSTSPEGQHRDSPSALFDVLRALEQRKG